MGAGVGKIGVITRVSLSSAQRNIYAGVLQDADPALYLIGKSYRFHRLELSKFLSALRAMIFNNPVQLCVLEAVSEGLGYPELVGRLRFDDLVRVRPTPGDRPDRAELMRAWSSGILATPLVRYVVDADEDGYVSGLGVFAHHLLLDGSATGIIERDLARHLLTGDTATEKPCITDGLSKVARAHQREGAKVAEALRRLADTVQRELAAEAGDYGASGTAAKGVLRAAIHLSGKRFAAIRALSEAKGVPLNALVAAAAVAVHASLRQSTESLLIYPVDNRFGEPDLHVATCLVNSVAHPFRFPSFASAREVIRTLDRGYVTAARRRWFREEHYRRMYLAAHRALPAEALTLNFLRESCAPGLRPFLSETPEVTDIGPVEGMTVTGVLDEDRHTLSLAVWSGAGLLDSQEHAAIAQRIVAALESMAALWHQPIAGTVNEWFDINPDGSCHQGDAAIPTDRPIPAAWFLDPAGGVQRALERRLYVYPWVVWLVRNGIAPGDVVVFVDHNTDKALDLVLASHLAGCGYSVCETADEVGGRADSVAGHGDGFSAHPVDVAAAQLVGGLSGQLWHLVNRRIGQVTRDPRLATKPAYLMATSGSTGSRKLVLVSHGSLALFCDAVRRAYGWGTHDTVLQYAPLTSDISVEEIFGGASCGSALVRSVAMKTGDLEALTRDVLVKGPTIVDLPTAVWHLLCEDDAMVDAISRSRLRQIVIGGEAIWPSVINKWLNSAAGQSISLVSSYGPTETTVVVSYLPITGGAWLRLGRPMVPNTVFIAFGEVVIVGDTVAVGYLGVDSGGFGSVTAADGSTRRAFATADRVIVDQEGFPILAGRKDAVVKVSGKRVDIAEITTRIWEDPAVLDVAVELRRGSSVGGLGVWFVTRRTGAGAEDAAAAARIRSILIEICGSSFFVVGVPTIPRKPNGKVDSDALHAVPSGVGIARNEFGAQEQAAGLAELWSRCLGRVIRPDTSLLAEGVGSLELIRVLPDTRQLLGRRLSLLELISADTATSLVAAQGWADGDTPAEVERDLALLGQRRSPKPLDNNSFSRSREQSAIVVLGASGILGTGFARAILDLHRAGVRCPDVILVVRSKLPECDPWTVLQHLDGVRIIQLSAEFGAAELDALLCDTGAGTVVNCIGNTNVLVPYRDLRWANVELVAIAAEICAHRGVRLVHLSTSVVNAEVTAAQVTDPRASPYPYAASKSLAELIVAGSPAELDFTLVRLPRVLGEEHQLRCSADVLVSVVDACRALRTYPRLVLTEEVTTGLAVAKAVLGLLPELAGPATLGRGITVVRGAAVAYAELLNDYADAELDVAQWQHRLDHSDWAKRNPRRWSVVDAWLTLGKKLAGRSYAEYLAVYPTIALGVDPLTEIVAPPTSIPALLACQSTEFDSA